MWSEFVKIADILNKKDAKNKKNAPARRKTGARSKVGSFFCNIKRLFFVALYLEKQRKGKRLQKNIFLRILFWI
ncbi:hypothetical protein [Treponema berlinense]|uniref:hypothetical protein n=1 Tax=Treponema berlinense TaxID=225004 RepID=UPI002357A5FF|nr:hypothetical protein [Treponema berlinense]